ncbi:DUF924 domain-containing protein [Anabaena sp. FACHB-1237]|uniref:DUF924 family protein n=1 Tax=Anabaena sp. FACHB-1237 TaxID=2692769 RepID=UPI001680CA9C|nr:DUF924 family protein [Anabaena sp. FACHB-1237]MBD2137852.1 DUF924 domain-containing protein [Anabaena sp. FACHB-1237]
MPQSTAILHFWFGSPDQPDYGKPQLYWFDQKPDFDDKVNTLFLEYYEKAAGGFLDHWRNQPHSCLALILLLDQFPRYMFRGTPQAFATDWEALSIAQEAISKGFDRQLITVQRWFLYIPFKHSENLAHQRKCVKLFQQLSHDPESSQAIEAAFKDKEIIARFGRFPHRNEILGRVSTPEEEEFLEEMKTACYSR